ncbi:MAG TPA: carboxypeptidase-like regulatory domain-containing protein [Methanocella sp.]|nr:carboxypeptidase-like regulatory domain-containing protein [Methanocella sp.]
MRSVKTLLLCIFFSLLLAQAFRAAAYEGNYFSIYGTVTDANWNPIPGALVTLYDNDFNRITTQDTNANGSFYFQGVSVKTNLCNVRVSYTEGGTEHRIPGYYIPAYPANGDQRVDPKQTHFDDYYLPGSQPRETPTPMPSLTPTDTPLPPPASDDSQGTEALIFSGGFIGGLVTATLACLIVFRRPGIK